MCLRFAFASHRHIDQLPAKLEEKHHGDKQQDAPQKTENYHEMMVTQSNKTVFVDLG